MIRTIVAKVAAVIGGVAQWSPVQAIGIAVATSLRWVVSQAVGVAVKGYYSLVSAAAAGVAATGTFAGLWTAAQAAGIAQSIVANLGASNQAAGAAIVRITYSLTGTYGAASAAVSHPSGSADWATPANAVGTHNATNATAVGTLSAAVDEVLTLTHAALTGKTALTITQVLVVFYASFTKGTVGAPTMALRYSLNGGTSYTTLQTLAATAAGPFSFDITSAIAGNWSNLQSLRAQLEFVAPIAGQTHSATCDAVEFAVTANTTQVP